MYTVEHAMSFLPRFNYKIMNRSKVLVATDNLRGKDIEEMFSHQPWVREPIFDDENLIKATMEQRNWDYNPLVRTYAIMEKVRDFDVDFFRRRLVNLVLLTGRARMVDIQSKVIDQFDFSDIGPAFHGVPTDDIICPECLARGQECSLVLDTYLGDERNSPRCGECGNEDFFYAFLAKHAERDIDADREELKCLLVEAQLRNVTDDTNPEWEDRARKLRQRRDMRCYCRSMDEARRISFAMTDCKTRDMFPLREREYFSQ